MPNAFSPEMRMEMRCWAYGVDSGQSRVTFGVVIHLGSTLVAQSRRAGKEAKRARATGPPLGSSRKTTPKPFGDSLLCLSMGI